MYSLICITRCIAFRVKKLPVPFRILSQEEPEINPKQVIETKADSVPPRAAPAASRAAPAASRAAPAVPRAAAAVPAAPPVEEENEKDDGDQDEKVEMVGFETNGGLSQKVPKIQESDFEEW